MTFDISWRTQAGSRTDDNRDYAGVGVRGEEALCVVLDGSTRGRGSGDLVGEIARALVDEFVGSGAEVTPEALKARLRELHRRLATHRPLATASYMLVHVSATGSVLALHAGDCLLGRPESDGAVSWLSRPDTLADVSGDMDIPGIAAHPARHRVTRSFRAREFMEPSVLILDGERELFVATDGFWADLDGDRQARFLAGEDEPASADADDRSLLRIRIQSGDPRLDLRLPAADGMIYVRTTGKLPSA